MVKEKRDIVVLCTDIYTTQRRMKEMGSEHRKEREKQSKRKRIRRKRKRIARKSKK